MSDINPNSGIEDELDISESLARAEQKIKVKKDSRSYNKEMTVVEGLGDDIDLDELSSAMKSKLACGGTAKDGHIELQGDHTRRIKDVLAEEGFDKENIEVQ